MKHALCKTAFVIVDLFSPLLPFLGQMCAKHSSLCHFASDVPLEDAVSQVEFQRVCRYEEVSRSAVWVESTLCVFRIGMAASFTALFRLLCTSTFLLPAMRVNSLQLCKDQFAGVGARTGAAVRGAGEALSGCNRG